MLILNVIFAVLCINLICSRAVLVAILAVILDLEVAYILKIIFDGFIGSGMVKNIYLYTKSVAAFAILMHEVNVFSGWHHQPF